MRFGGIATLYVIAAVLVMACGKEENKKSFDYKGIDGLSKNLPSRIVSSQNNRYEYTYSGERVSTVEKHLIADTNPTLHFYTDYTLDFEYVQ